MLFDLLFPKTCLSCGRFGRYICQNCRNDLVLIPHPICMYCRKASENGLTHPWCMRLNGIDGYLGVFFYNTTLKKIIKSIKYRLITDAWGEFFNLINASSLKQFFNFSTQVSSAVFQPIPLHKKRQLLRGFNQAQVITRYFSGKLPYKTIDILTRSVEVPPQAQLADRSQRYLNVKRIFSLKKSLERPKLPIILVDDVVTTGSTVGEAAHLLKKSGIERVFVFSVAKG